MVRGDIYYVDLGKPIDSVQGGVRPCVIIQNDTGNKHSTTTIICPLTTKQKTELPTHCSVYQNLPKASTILCEQILTVSKRQVRKYICTLNDDDLNKLNECLKRSIGI